MKKEVFLSDLKDVLELESLHEDSMLLFSSLAILGVIAYIDETFDKRFKAVDLKSVKSIPELIELIGIEFE